MEKMEKSPIEIKDAVEIKDKNKVVINAEFLVVISCFLINFQ